MKANFYIHGVPKGQDVWGSEQDRDYIKSFYSASYSESVRFVVELIPSKKRTFYTYIRSKNVYGSENREGSYFGMTVSFDGIYCTDNESLFTLFDTIFNKRIVGSVLQNQNGNYRFSVAAFEGKSKELESIQAEFLKQLDSFADDLENMDNSFTGSSNGQVAYYNVSDIDNSNFFAVLRKTLKVYISPEYPTKDGQIASLKKQVEPEKSKNKQLTDEKAELEAKLSAATDKNKRNETELSQLRQEKQQLEDDNKKLWQENASLKSESERNKSKKSIESSVNQIRQPLEDLVKHIRKAMPVSSYDEPHHYHHKEEQISKGNNILSIIRDVALIIILLLVIGIAIVNINNVKSIISSSEPKVAKNDTIISKSLYNKLMANYETLLKEKKEWTKQSNEERDEEENNQKAIQFSINIEPKVDSVEIGKEYSFVVNGYEGSGEWKVYGFTQPHDKRAKSIRIKVVDLGIDKKNAVISYTPDGGEKKKRTFTIKR